MDDRLEAVGKTASRLPPEDAEAGAVPFAASAYKDLIAITDGVASERFLGQSAAIAGALGARLQIAFIAPSPSPSRYTPNIDGAATERLALAGAAKASACRAEIEARMRLRVHLVAGEPERIAREAAELAVHASLALLPDNSLCGNPALRDRVAAALLDQASCPLLIVRGGGLALPARSAAIAWNGSKASSRAWRDALPLLAGGALVDVAIGGVRAATKLDGVPIETLMAEHLGAQGFACRTHEIPLHPMGDEWRSAPARLAEFEVLVQPDLFVMGAGKAADGDGLSELTSAMIRDGRSALLLSR